AFALDHNLRAALTSLGWCKLYAGSLGEVTPLAEQAVVAYRSSMPGIGWSYILIGTVHLLQSRTAELKAFPGPWVGEAKTRALFEATYFAGLRKAGMPEK